MSKSKLLAMVIAVGGAVGLITIAACAGVFYMAFTSANASITPAIDRLFSKIESGTFASTYDTDTAKEFRSGTSRQQYSDIGDAVSTRLGRLKSKSLRTFNMRQLKAESFADVSYNATFEKGIATIRAHMKREGSQWKLVRFSVTSSVFEQDMATMKCPKCRAPHARSASFCPSCGASLKESSLAR